MPRSTKFCSLLPCDHLDQMSQPAPSHLYLHTLEISIIILWIVILPTSIVLSLVHQPEDMEKSWNSLPSKFWKVLNRNVHGPDSDHIQVLHLYQEHCTFLMETMRVQVSTQFLWEQKWQFWEKKKKSPTQQQTLPRESLPGKWTLVHFLLWIWKSWGGGWNVPHAFPRLRSYPSREGVGGPCCCIDCDSPP